MLPLECQQHFYMHFTLPVVYLRHMIHEFTNKLHYDECVVFRLEGARFNEKPGFCLHGTRQKA